MKYLKRYKLFEGNISPYITNLNTSDMPNMDKHKGDNMSQHEITLIRNSIKDIDDGLNMDYTFSVLYDENLGEYNYDFHFIVIGYDVINPPYLVICKDKDDYFYVYLYDDISYFDNSNNVYKFDQIEDLIANLEEIISKFVKIIK